VCIAYNLNLLTIEHGAFLCSNILEIEGIFLKTISFAKLNQHFEEERLVM
jgi:hypothetical protein